MQLFNVRDYGAAGDGVTLDTAAIQNAIDKCSDSGGGTVYFTKGVYLSGTLELKSYVTLDLSPNAVLLASPEKKDYRGVAEHEDFIGSSYFLIGCNIEKFSIKGQGTIDGNGPEFWTEEVINNVPNLGPIVKPKSYRPRALLYITDSSDIHFTDVTFKNSPCFTIWILGCDKVNIDNIVIDNLQHGPNSDGIDVDCCSNVHISNCHISAGDDCIALKSDAKRLGKRKACEYITVTNCTFSSRACGVRIGYEGDAPIRNCCFSNITMMNTDIGFSIVSILLNPPTPPAGAKRDQYLEVIEGCTIERINIDNIIMDNVNTPFYMWVGSEADKGIHQGCIRDINISNVFAVAYNMCGIYGMPENKVESVDISNFKMRITKPVSPREEKPPYESGVWGIWGIPYAFYLRNARDVSFRDVEVDWTTDASDGWAGVMRFDECLDIDDKGLKGTKNLISNN